MAKLQMLSFEDDDIVAQRIKQESNYCDAAHLYVATYGICQVALKELSPIDLDGNGRHTICANVENQNVTPGYKNWKVLADLEPAVETDVFEKECEQAEAELRKKVDKIDATAIENPEGLWSTMIEEMGAGIC